MPGLGELAFSGGGPNMHTFLVVLYKRRISEVPTLATLNVMRIPSGSDAEIIIWDNSPADFIQEPLSSLDVLRRRFREIKYMRSSENRPLSIIYNQVLSDSFGGGSALVTLLDHDSELQVDFKLRIDSAVNGDLFIVPKVVSNRSHRVISPRYQTAYCLSLRPPEMKALAAVASGTYPAKDFFAVGSGMTVTRELWATGIRFDETLRFYGIDTEFCRDYSAAHESFAVADTVVLHDISSEGNEDNAIVQWRFNSYMDYWVYQLEKHSMLPRFAVRIYVAAWRMLMNIHFMLKARKRFR
jgi:GT2 family glycosyltransferase